MTAAFLALVAVVIWPTDGWYWRGEAPAGGGVVPTVLRRVRGVRLRPVDDTWVADVAEVVAVGLDAGLDLPRAVRAASRSPSVRSSAPWLEGRVAEAVYSGGVVSACLDPPGTTTPGTLGDLGLLVAAWRLAEESGAPASAVTTAAAEAVRERRASRERAAVAVAGPRTSMWLLTGLPVLGPVGAAAAGLGPDRLYATPGSGAAASAGLVLTALGWIWARRLLARAARAATTGVAPPAERRRPLPRQSTLGAPRRRAVVGRRRFRRPADARWPVVRP